MNLQNKRFVSTKQLFLYTPKERFNRWVAKVAKTLGTSAKIWEPDGNRREVRGRLGKHLPGGPGPWAGTTGEIDYVYLIPCKGELGNNTHTPALYRL